MANGVEEHGARLKTLEAELQHLRDWKHDVYTEQHNALLLKVIQIEYRLATMANGGSRVWEIVRPIITALLTGFVLWLAVVMLKLYPIVK